MSVLYLYAVVRDVPAALGRGLGGERLEVLRSAGLAAVVGRLAAPPPLSRTALRAHDRVVRRVAAATDAVLPARFGSTVADAGALDERLAGRAVHLAAALDTVAGREQMTLRLYAAEAAAPPEGPAAPSPPPGTAMTSMPGTGPGARYLAGRSRAEWTVPAAALEALRPALAGLVEAERVEPHATPPLLASVYHAVRRGRAGAYRQAVARGPATPGVRVSVSGPSPPYAFAPEGPV